MDACAWTVIVALKRLGNHLGQMLLRGLPVLMAPQNPATLYYLSMVPAQYVFAQFDQPVLRRVGLLLVVATSVAIGVSTSIALPVIVTMLAAFDERMAIQRLRLKQAGTSVGMLSP